MNPSILGDFQICISVPLSKALSKNKRIECQPQLCFYFLMSRFERAKYLHDILGNVDMSMCILGYVDMI